MTTQKIKLFCILDGDSSSFPVDIPLDVTIGDLKEAIKEKKPNDLQGLEADRLEKKLEELEDPTSEVSEVFGTTPAKKTIHVIVQRPSAEDLEATVKRISARFFADDSPAAIFLNEYVKGAKTLPVTTDSGIPQLPRAWRRGKTSEPTLESRPNFLFLDLPAAPSDNIIPDQFSSNSQVVEKREA
ncbi:hypothetical protein BGX27_002332, partial [Mortierella sp. AM989]